MIRFQAYRCLQRILLPSTLHQRIDNPRFYSEKKQPDINALVAELVGNSPAIAEYGQAYAVRTFEVLQTAGFGPDECAHIINQYPKILRFQRNDLENRLEIWKVCQMSRTQYFHLFTEQPMLLECDDEAYLVKRWCNLQKFAWTSKNIWRLLIQSPNVLFDSMSSIDEKVDYILENMEADMTDLVKSGSLALPIEKIKARHVLLQRLGIYKKRNRKASVLDANKNPRLTRIMDSSDQEFARKHCGISTGELDVFYEFYERELKELEKERHEYEENTDTESDKEDSDEEYNYDPRVSDDYYDDRQKRSYSKDPRLEKS